MTAGLAPAARLRKAREFDQVFAARKRIAGQYFTFVLGPGTGPQARLGLAIAKKQARYAHERNLLKRVCREAFRRLLPKLAPVDIVVLARTGADRAERTALHADLQHLLARLETRTP